MEQNNFSPIERNEIGIRNEMQVRLAALGGQSFNEYVVTHAKEFGELVEKNPDLLDKYEQNQEETLEKIKQIIYH